jgi:hypothetical protein
VDVPSERLFLPLGPPTLIIFDLPWDPLEISCVAASRAHQPDCLKPVDIPVFLCGVINKDTSSFPECRHFR